MSDSRDAHLHQQGSRIPYWLGTCVFLVVMGFFLWEEHQALLLGAVPYVLLLLCPVIHLLMHRGHSGPSSHHQRGSPGSRAERGTP